MESFVRLMNEKAASLGLTRTHFENPHGLDAKEHFSTARDLAMLMLYAMEDPRFRELVGRKTAELHGRTLFNHNRLLALCPGCLGGKTGYTMAAGRCLVSCCERDGLRLVCVTLSAPDDWNDHLRLYDWAYSAYTLFDPAEKADFSVPVISGSRPTAKVRPAADLSLLLPRGTELALTAELPAFVFAPVRAGDPAGTLIVKAHGETVASCPLVYAEEALLASPCLHPLTWKELLS